MLTIIPKETKQSILHNYLLHSIAPRPICFASTIDKDGNPNLSPFSFFNVFSSNPPIAIFSPARRGRDNTTKHTLENIKEHPEVVINIVNYNMVQQMNLSSCEYPKGISEFEKSGFTPIDSDYIKPFRVKESPVQMECKVNDVVELGQMGGAGNLVICEILAIHIQKEILNEHNMIDQHKIDLVGRLGADWYVRAAGNALFEVEKPNIKLGIGIDNIPDKIRNSSILSGNDLGVLGNIEKLPLQEEVINFKNSDFYKKIKSENMDETSLHSKAKELISNKMISEAWLLLLSE